MSPDEARFGWALVGPGRIAHRFAEAVQGTEGMALVCAQGRDLARSGAFARKWSLDGRPVAAVSTLDEALDDARVDGVYIATPHPFHGASILRCLEAGKAVLCEKPLVPTLAEGLEAVGLARRKRAFLMEAVWTRFLPIYAVVRDWLRDGAIGPVRAIQSSFCFNLPFDAAHRAYDPAQAGGALLDIGIYNLTMTRWTLAVALGECPALSGLQASAVLGPTGVDHRLAATLGFAGGVVSQFVCGFDLSADNTLRILGEHGSITVPSFWQATEAYRHVQGREMERVQRPFRVNGFEYEATEAAMLARAGAVECERMSHEESLETLRWMCRIREEVGVRYPFEGSAPAARAGYFGV